MTKPASPTLIRADQPQVAAERFPDLDLLARRLHGLRAGRKLDLRQTQAAFEDLDCVGWSVWTVAADLTRAHLGVVLAPGFDMPPLREALGRTAPRAACAATSWASACSASR